MIIVWVTIGPFTTLTTCWKGAVWQKALKADFFHVPNLAQAVPGLRETAA